MCEVFVFNVLPASEDNHHYKMKARKEKQNYTKKNDRGIRQIDFNLYLESDAKNKRRKMNKNLLKC